MSKPTNRLGGLIQPKGAAPRPVEIPQRGAPAEPVPTASVPAPAPEPKAAKADKKEPTKSLTLKLPESEYELLREYSFRNRKSHQEVMREALLKLLKDEKSEQ